MTTSNDLKKTSGRVEELTAEYFAFLDQHLADLVSGKSTEMMELSEISKELCVSHQHLIAVIQQSSGNHPCHFYDFKILELARQLLKDTALPVAEIARRLTYDPSNFSKFFKKYSGETPGQFRKKTSALKKPKSSP
ncbi:helix-turn-helix domain-containing protein [Pedobacter caeni]|uniref:AraC-type DNA-binding protein n=1 Tax=Pedobacter caeni TaxID=288992 RepID=A0A1M5B5M3_9SPHI|nr:AraC family transcriptional regulator [Pedobacter caeni]SHF37814.1 AraC-type DNA-binding protein [Pedobacter caeni]